MRQFGELEAVIMDRLWAGGAPGAGPGPAGVTQIMGRC